MNRDKVTLKHMGVYIAGIESYTKGMTYNQFIDDRKTMQAVAYAILNVGELSNLLSDDIKMRNEHIPWQSIKGMRNRAAHGYHFFISRIHLGCGNHRYQNIERSSQKRIQESE